MVNPSITLRVISALELPMAKAYVEHVQGALDHVEGWGGPPAIAEIVGLLNQIQTYDTAISAAIVSGQGGIIKADVVEWAPGGATKQSAMERDRLRVKLATLLALTDLMPSSGSIRIIR
jgi:hypothetical protein